MNDDRELLFSINKKDFEVTTFKGSGPGGQKKNKTSSGVRIKHKDSGAVGVCSDTRSQHKNKEVAFKRCIESYKFKRWHSMEIRKRLGQESIEDKVERQMQDHLLKIECFNGEEWIETK